MSVNSVQKISPMLWFDHQAEEAANFYMNAFPNSKIGTKSYYGKEGFEVHGMKEGTVMTIDFEIDGYKFSALNGGPIFKFNPSVSFFVTYETEKEIDELWKKLTEGGMVLMAMDKYPFSEKFGWVMDKFGISWQVSLGKKSDVGNNTIVPFFLFTKEQHGKAEAAVNYYISVFKKSSLTGILRFGSNEAPEIEGTVKHAQFVIEGQTFMAMESAHNHEFVFNEAISMVIECETQEEIDYYWENLTKGGDPKAQVCGWLKDQFGVSWQVVPTILNDMMQDKDPEKVARVTKAFLCMKKFDIEILKKAFETK